MPNPPGSKRKASWHAVSIATRGDACAAAQALRERRFLAKEAPQLPLKDCSQSASCKCVYKHYDDRRAGPRRSSEATGLRSSRQSGERRGGRGRRESD